MTAQTPDNIRNIAFFAHSGAGKTSLIESLLFASGAIKEKAAVDKGKGSILTEPEEASHHVAITVHVGHINWRNTEIHFVDTPGSFNFLESGRGVLPNVDSSIFLFTGEDGIHPESERLWAMLESFGVPAIGFVNQMDLPSSDLGKAATAIERLIKKPVEPLTFPLRSAGKLVGVIDLLSEKIVAAKGLDTSVPTDLPDAVKNEIARARTHLIERIVENNDLLLEKYLGGAEIELADLLAALKQAVLKRSFLPLVCGSGNSDIGVVSLLNYIVDITPNPLDRDTSRPIIGHEPGNSESTLSRVSKATDPFAAGIIKTIIDPFFGKLSVVRVLSGEVRANALILNSSRSTRQKTGHVYQLQGKKLNQVETLSAGEFGAIAKLEDSHTGDTLCAIEEPIVLPEVHFADPAVSYAVECGEKGDEKVAAALMKLVDEDPSLHFYRDEATHQMILAGMGQTHIEVTLEKLERKFGAHANLRTPRVAYRETIRGKTKVQGKLKKQTGGHGQFANVWLEVEPLPRGIGFQFEDKIAGGIIPKQYIPAVQKGVHDALQKGILGGYPVVDIKVTLYDGSYHDVDSSDYAFQVAGSLGLKAALEEVGSQLLEPIMSMRVVVPEDCAGAVIKDISSRRGKILSLDARDSWREVSAETPLAELLNYGEQLSAMTSGRGTYTMHIHAYQEVPPYLEKKVLESSKAA